MEDDRDASARLAEKSPSLGLSTGSSDVTGVEKSPVDQEDSAVYRCIGIVCMSESARITVLRVRRDSREPVSQPNQGIQYSREVSFRSIQETET